MRVLRDIWSVGLLGRFARRWPLVVLCALVTAPLAWCAPALALSQRGHVFSFSYGSKGSGEGGFSGPLGVAVNDVTGDVYVADRKNKRVVQLEPVVNGQDELVSEKFVRSFEVPTPSGVAVDDSTEASDPSRGDVYVVGDGAKVVYKFSAEGAPIGALKSFETREEKEETEAEEKKKKRQQEKASKLEGVVGVAVDAGGSLFVHEEGGAVDRFTDAVVNEGESRVETGLQGTPGLALDSEDNLFVGMLGTGGFPVVSKLEGITGKVLIGALDGEETTGVAVNTSDVPANEVVELNDVYAVSAGSVAQFAPETGGVPGALIQRFPSEGEEEAHGGSILRQSAGIAVDDATGMVFVTDSTADALDAFALEAAGPVRIEGVSAQSVASLEGRAERLSARIDPDGADARYRFEYGTSSCAATPSPCTATSPVDLGDDFGDREVGLELQDLAPGTYHYRVVAESSFGTLDSPEHSFTLLQTVSGLPDGRAWELVSPPDKHGAPIEPLTHEGGLILASEDGDAMTYVADGAITDGAVAEETQGNRSPELQQALSTRTESGWVSRDIATPQVKALGLETGSAPEYRFFSPKLSSALVEPPGQGAAEPPLAEGVTQTTLYVRDDATGSYVPLVTNANAPGVLFGQHVHFAGATPDLSHVVIDSGVALLGGSSAPGLYEWSGGALQFVSVLPSGVAAHEAQLGYYNVAANAVSSDGSRVIWTSPEENLHRGHLYMRDTATGETVELDAAQGVTEPAGTGVAQFQSASSNGSRVFFTDDERLTADSTAEPTHERADLYMCEMVVRAGKLACELRDLTVDYQAGGASATVRGFLFGTSTEGTSVYLVAQGVLAGNENTNGERALAGADNLYVLAREGNGEWSRTFIARLSGEDSAEWDEDNPGWNGAIPGDSAFVSARVSANGRFLAFMSQNDLTGYDNEDLSSVHPGERLDEEVYLYDASDQSLTCVSCDPSGARPQGVLDSVQANEGLGLLIDKRKIWAGHWLGGDIPGWTAQNIESALYQSRYLSNEGRLFFNSPDDLIAQAVNHKNDVYEYEPAGVGSCQGASGGCVALISAGTGAEESAFLEASSDGGSVFFLTAARLLPQDTDTAFDIYDARVCTSESPCLSPPAPPPAGCATTEVCRAGPFSGQGEEGASGTSAFTGPGNLAPSPAKQEVKGVQTHAKPLTRKQKLARALAECRKRYKHSTHKRTACEKQARGRYAAAKKSTQKKSADKNSRRK